VTGTDAFMGVAIMHPLRFCAEQRDLPAANFISPTEHDDLVRHGMRDDLLVAAATADDLEVVHDEALDRGMHEACTAMRCYMSARGAEFDS
jgi:hypothetical protein